MGGAQSPPNRLQGPMENGRARPEIKRPARLKKEIP
jgi:hypothetical protein